MAHANAHHDHRQATGQYPEASSDNDRQHDQDRDATRHDGHPSQSLPQFSAPNERFRHGNDDYYAPRHSRADAPSYGPYNSRRGSAQRLMPQRFGDYDEVRHDYFGYPETERQSHRLEPSRHRTGEPTWGEATGPYDQEYGNFGSPPPRQPEPWRAHPGPGSMYWGEGHAGGDERDGEGYGVGHDGREYSAVGHGAGHERHIDPDYRQWRREQIQNLDRDYDDWRRERYTKFSDEFNNWRSTRTSREPSQAEHTANPAGTKHSASGATATLPAGMSSSGTKL